ncbi:hypothetical protein PanWU01x14_099270 [Parasponia andersonii]|uniref:Uncharacterized protein n=1 Tax=Parasponia andersonii TaxID=3476 RepID=A0A2P5D3Q3_PARAD|nr:hypothetical protein PanWU01x14_099270 [Parasponia andersonii]
MVRYPSTSQIPKDSMVRYPSTSQIPKDSMVNIPTFCSLHLSFSLYRSHDSRSSAGHGKTEAMEIEDRAARVQHEEE